MKYIKKQKGFTMIELVIVIAILGILAAFALPRFSDFTLQSKTSAADGVVAAYNSAIGIVKAKYVAGGSIGDTVTLEDKVIAVTPTGDVKITTAAECFNAARSLTTLNFSEKNGPSLVLHGLFFDTGTLECRVDNTKYKWKVKLTPTGATKVIEV